MHHRDRRVGARVAFPVFLDQYVGDRRFRALATDVSESGIFVHQVAGRRPRGRVCALEIELPGLGETIWARGEIRRRRGDGTVDGHGIALTGMARSHARMLRAYCVEARRRQLADLLARIRC
jgi:hypothetical protein